MVVKSWPRSVYGERIQMGWLVSWDRPGEEEPRIGERMQLPARLESISSSCSSFSGEEAAAIMTPNASNITWITTLPATGKSRQKTTELRELPQSSHGQSWEMDFTLLSAGHNWISSWNSPEDGGLQERSVRPGRRDVHYSFSVLPWVFHQ